MYTYTRTNTYNVPRVRDAGHGGMTLQDFVDSAIARAAELTHVDFNRRICIYVY